MFWLSRALSAAWGLFSGASRIASIAAIAAVLLGGFFVFAYQLGSSDTAQSYEVARLQAQLEAERDGRRKANRARAELRRTIERMQAKSEVIEDETPVPAGAGAECRVSRDFLQQVAAGYRDSE